MLTEIVVALDGPVLAALSVLCAAFLMSAFRFGAARLKLVLRGLGRHHG